jgi:hypothetical protein
MVFWLLIGLLNACDMAHDNESPDCWTGGDGPRRS